MRDNYVIVYNEGNDRTSYIRVVAGDTTTCRVVTDATIFETWNEAWDKIEEMREHNDGLGYKSGMFFPLGVNKKDIFLSKLKGN